MANKAQSYTVNVYYSDLKDFPGLADVLTKFPKMYRVTEYHKNFMVVAWNGTTLGNNPATRAKNDELLSPYTQADRFAKKGTILIF